MTEFHSEEYIGKPKSSLILDLLKNINEQNCGMYQDLFSRFGFSADCPWPTNSKFYDFCKLYTSGSMLGAELLSLNEVNWCFEIISRQILL